MSADATSWAWKQPLPAVTKLVLLALADLADGNTNAIDQLTADRLAERTGLGIRTIRYHLRALERSCHLVEEERRDTGGRRLANRHHLNVNGLAPVALPIETAWRSA